MSIPTEPKTSPERAAWRRLDERAASEAYADRQLSRWGGLAGIAGVGLMLGAVGVVVGFGLPDAADAETLTDFADIETGRILEHLCYLGAVIMFALHTLVLGRLLRRAHPAAALFGTAVATFGFVVMAAGAVLHVSTRPLAELYTSPDTPAGDLVSIEHAWYGAQSVFDTMLLTGVLLVPIGIVLLGVAMLNAPAFGRRLAWMSVVLGAVGMLGAAAEIVDSTLEFSALSVGAMVVFHLVTGLRTLTVGRNGRIAAHDGPAVATD